MKFPASHHPALLLAAMLLCVAAPACAQATKEAKEPKLAPAPALLLSPLAGQSIPVLPVTYLVADSASNIGLPADLHGRLRWADSLVGEVLQMRGPEVTWLLGEELRRIARRAPGTINDPDKMGQAMLRADGLKRIPDPLFSQLRMLAALTNGRQVMVPAAVRFQTVPTGIRAEVVLVLADARSGALLWRSTPFAIAATPAAALTAAVARILPDFN
ncbi:MAG: hypothetical protein KBF28_06120 [Gemmatimonadales bacterium]|nr:hypothetical protein [Gemmatimonadales bacterium]